jgi:hypothetical protein
MDRSECVHGILHCLPACVRDVLWECEASSHRFSINGLLPQKRCEDARTRQAGCAHSKSPATAGRNTKGENLRKLATAISSCGELRKLSSIAVRVSRIPRLSFRAKSRNLSILFPILPLGHSRTITAAWRFFFAALELEHHVLNA